MQDHLGGPAVEEAQHPACQVGQEATASEQEVESVVPHILEGAGEVEKRGCRTSAAVEVVDLPRRLDIAVVTYGIPGPVCGIHQSGKGIFSSVAAAEAMLAGIKEADRVRAKPSLHKAFGHFDHHRGQ